MQLEFQIIPKPNAQVIETYIGVLQSYPLEEISSRDLNGEEVKENNR